MFTDIAASTTQLTRIGDRAWRELLAGHHRDVDAHLARFGGREIKRLGDGCLAVFDGPARAIRCAQGILAAATRRGLALRVGLHCGECDILEGDVQGIAVHTASRIVELATPGQILTSSTLRDLVAGSGIRFGSARRVELEGIAGTRTVLPVITQGATPDEARRLTIDRTNALHRDGEYWTVAYDGRIVTLRDSKGLRDIAQLLASPHQETHVLDLVTEAGGTVGSTPASQARDAGLHLAGRVDDPILDDTAKAAYKHRILELEQAIDDATAHGDGESAARAQQERDTLVTELANAYGLAGRTRSAPDHIERARKRVSRRIREALRRIQHEHPDLGRHLHASLHTGVYCGYQPERDVTWLIRT